ncbi:hypothetical protein KCP70_00460 [Salmonella enterica subsp. enterica]|nr:hypothetical protein KCP70_00460 [Salmonella enterica subsp. enterica]
MLPTVWFLNRPAGEAKIIMKSSGFNKIIAFLCHINTQTITKTNKQMKDNSVPKYKKIKYPTYSHWFRHQPRHTPVNMRDQMMRNLPPYLSPNIFATLIPMNEIFTIHISMTLRLVIYLV